MKYGTRERGSAVIVVLILIVLLAVGVVGYMTYAGQNERTENTSNHQPAKVEVADQKSDADQIKALVAKRTCGPGEGTVLFRAIILYENFATLGSHCIDASGGGAGAAHILKKAGSEWEHIGATQDSCLSLDYQTEHGMTEDVRSNLFPDRLEFCPD